MKSKLTLRVSSFSKYLTSFSPINQKIIVNEFPKSGGTWLCKSLADAVGYRFLELSIYPSLFGKHILHTHHFSLLKLASSCVLPIYLIRNPFDSYISLYYHSLFYNNKGNSVLVDSCRSVMGSLFEPSDFSESFYWFLLNLKANKFKYLYTWESHVARASSSPDYSIVKYESLWDDAFSLISSLLLKYSIPFDSSALSTSLAESRVQIMRARERFDSQSVQPYSQVSFQRRGGYGDWSSILDDRHVSLINQGAGPMFNYFYS